MSPEHQAFFKHPIAKRNKEGWECPRAEAAALQSNRKKKEVSLLDKLERVSSEWKITPYQVIHEFKDYKDILADPSWQALFFRLFFRSAATDPEGFARLGMGDLILRDEALIQNCAAFINEGLQHFYKKKDKEGIHGARFFLELSYYLSKYLKDAGREEAAGTLAHTGFVDRWLLEPDVTVKTSSVLHLYRLLSDSLSLGGGFLQKKLNGSIKAGLPTRFIPTMELGSLPCC